MPAKDRIFQDLQSYLGNMMDIHAVDFFATTEIGDVQIRGTVFKRDDEKQLVYGWASVIEKGGEQLIDLHGEVIEEEDLLKAAHKFMTDFREGKVMHKGEQVGEVVESIVFTKDIQEALGIDLGMVGWFIGYQVHDPSVWKKVKSGELPMFSIGGTAVREDA